MVLRLWTGWPHRRRSKRICIFFGLDHAPQFRVEDKKGVPGVWRRHIVGARNVFLEQEDIFAKGLGVSVIFSHHFRELYDGGDAFPVALRAVVNFWKFLVHPILIYSSNFWFFVTNRKLQLANNSQIRKKGGERHKNSKEKSVVTHQLRIFMHKAYPSLAKETMSWGLIETIAAARAAIQQTLSTVKISRVRGSVISILNICKKWRWGVSGTRCHRKCKKKIVVYKKVAETIEKSHRWPERRKTFWFSVCKFARSMAKRTFCSSHRVIPNGNSARQAGIRGHRFFTDNDWEGELKKE